MNQEQKALTVTTPPGKPVAFVASGGLIVAGIGAALVAGQLALGMVLAVLGVLLGAFVGIRRLLSQPEIPEDPVVLQINQIKSKLNKVIMGEGHEDGALHALDQLSYSKKKLEVFRRLISSKLS